MNTVSYFKSNIIRSTYLVSLTILFATHAWAQNIVNFQVYVEPELLTEGTQVIVLGSHSGLGNWGANGELRLSPSASQPNVFTGEADFEVSENPIEYKYVLRNRGENTWERDKLGNRRFWVEQGEQQLPLALYDEHAGPGTRQMFLHVAVVLDLSEFYLPEDEIEEVAILGGRSPLSFDLNAPRIMKKLDDGIQWGARFTFPYGTAKDIPIKFAWKTNGQWEWEWLPGHTIHALLLDDSHSQQLVRMRYNPETRTIGAAHGSEAVVDNWGAIFAMQGALAPYSKYRYEYAMQLMEAGNMEAAEEVFTDFEQRYAGGDEVNDYYYRKAEHLAMQGGIETALNLLEQQHHKERDPYRKAYYRYRQAEVLMLAGHHREASLRFEQVEWEYRQHRRLVEYARIGWATALTSDPTDTVSMEEGIALLESMNTEDDDGSSSLEFISQRVVKLQLVHLYGQTGRTGRQVEMLQQLSRKGTVRQQMKARMELARAQARAGEKEKALETLESVNEAQLSKRGHQQWRAQYIEHLWEAGYTEEVIAQVGHLRSIAEGYPHLIRYLRIEEQALEQMENGEAVKKGRRARAAQQQDATGSSQSGGMN